MCPTDSLIITRVDSTYFAVVYAGTKILKNDVDYTWSGYSTFHNFRT